jgi:hypothetical protein
MWRTILGDVDPVGIVLSLLLDTCKDDRALATRAAHSLCLTSTSVRAAVLACVQRVRMDAPLPALLQRMASLVSLHVGAGPLDTVAQLPKLTRLQADGISSPLTLSAIMQLTGLQELRLGKEEVDSDDMRRALDGISCLTSLCSMAISYEQPAAAARRHQPPLSPQQPAPGRLRQPAAAA